MIEVTRQVNALVKHQWNFTVTEHCDKITVRLSDYAELVRPTPRHKFQSTRNYNAYVNKRYNTIEAADVPLPDDVKDEVRSKIEIEFIV